MLLSNILMLKPEIDEVAQSISEQIEVVKKYRQALITEAVTGKIDVRGVML